MWFLSFSTFAVDHALYTERYDCYTLIKDVLFYIVFDPRLYLANITTEYIDSLSPDVTIIEEKSIKIKVTNTILDKGHKLKVHQTLRRRLGRLLNDLCMFNQRFKGTFVS